MTGTGAVLGTEIRGRLLVATIDGSVDFSNAEDLEGRIEAAASDLAGLVVDLRGVTFLDSAGVRLLEHLVVGRQPDPLMRVVVAAAGPVPFTLRLCDFRDELVESTVQQAVAALDSVG